MVDPRYNYRSNPTLVFAPMQQGVKHPIVDPLGTNRAVLLRGAAPITILGQMPRDGAATEPVDRDLVPTPILQTTRFSWAESDPQHPPLRLDPKTDKAGPLVVGVAVVRRPALPTGRTELPAEATPRLVLFSCPAMADNVFQEIEQTNLDLLMNAASWLRGKPDTQGITAHAHVALTLAIDPALRSRLILVPSVTAILLIIAMGIIVYVARRE